MTNQLKETVQEALQQLNKKGDGSLSEFSQYLANQSNALETLLHGLLEYLDEDEREDKKYKDIIKRIENTEIKNYEYNGNLHKKEIILNKKQVDELLQSAQIIKGSTLKDQTVNLTINVDYNKALENSKELGLRVSKVLEELMRKDGFSKQ